MGEYGGQYMKNLKGKKVLVLPITRKSYTTEVRMAIDKVRSYPGVKSLAITCDADSAKYNDYMIPVSYTHLDVYKRQL